MCYQWRVAQAFLVCGFFAAAESTHAGDDKSDSPHLAKFLLTGWQSEREKLLTGRVQMTGVANQGGHRADIKVSLTFDHPKRMRKYKVSWEGNCDGWWLLTPELLAQCSNLQKKPVVDIIKPTDKQLLPFVREFDPRCFGMNFENDIIAGITFDQICQRMSSAGLHQVKPIGQGLYSLQGTSASQQLASKASLIINEKKGFSCERFQVFTQVVKKTPPENPWVLGVDTSVEWEQRNGCWVPSSVVVQGLAKDRIELNLNWEQVNGQVGEKEFDLDHLGVPPGTTISDRRLSLQNPIIQGRTGKGSVWFGLPTLQGRTIGVLVLCTALTLGLVCYGFFRRWKTRAVTARGQ